MLPSIFSSGDEWLTFETCQCITADYRSYIKWDACLNFSASDISNCFKTLMPIKWAQGVP